MANGVKHSPEEMRDTLLTQLYDNRSELRGIALVQGIKALRDLIPPPPPPDPEEGERFSILDQLPSLPDAEGRRLVKEEIARLREELAAYESYLEMLEVKR